MVVDLRQFGYRLILGAVSWSMLGVGRWSTMKVCFDSWVLRFGWWKVDAEGNVSMVDCRSRWVIDVGHLKQGIASSLHLTCFQLSNGPVKYCCVAISISNRALIF